MICPNCLTQAAILIVPATGAIIASHFGVEAMVNASARKLKKGVSSAPTEPSKE